MLANPLLSLCIATILMVYHIPIVNLSGVGFGLSDFVMVMQAISPLVKLLHTMIVGDLGLASSFSPSSLMLQGGTSSTSEFVINPS